MREARSIPMEHLDMLTAKKMLETGSYTCVLYRSGTAYTATERGVRPLLTWLEQGIDLAGASAADKVVGKAAALLYCLLRVKAVHAGVMSKAACRVLEGNGISVTFGKLVDAIENRTKTGMCPMEMATAAVEDPAQAPAAIRKKLAELAGK